MTSGTLNHVNCPSLGEKQYDKKLYHYQGSSLFPCYKLYSEYLYFTQE